MPYAVYADLSRPLTEQERAALFAALDASVPDSGCVGRQKGPNDEVYFSLEAPSETTARIQAERSMRTILEKSKLDVKYTLTLQKMSRA